MICELKITNEKDDEEIIKLSQQWKTKNNQNVSKIFWRPDVTFQVLHFITPFHATDLFLYPLKTSTGNQGFSHVVRDFIKRPVALNGLTLRCKYFFLPWINHYCIMWRSSISSISPYSRVPNNRRGWNNMGGWTL